MARHWAHSRHVHPSWETVPDVSLPETCLQGWAHFLYLSRGLGLSQMVSPYSCFTRARPFHTGPFQTWPRVWPVSRCLCIYLGMALEGISFMLSDEAAAANLHTAPSGKEGREGASDCSGLTSAL